MELMQQTHLCAVLRHFQRGDFSTFKRICDLAGIKSTTNNPYFYSNQFLAAQIGGLIEVSEIQASTRWWISFNENPQIYSESPKSIGTEKAWFIDNQGDVSSLIKGEDGESLLLGVLSQKTKEAEVFFGKSFIRRLPTLPTIEAEALVEEQNFSPRESQFDFYDHTTSLWSSIDASELTVRGLIRIRKRFGGVEYFILHQDLGLAFRVLNREWMHFLAGHILNWNFNEVVRINNSCIRLPRQFRLPNIIYRFLFANAANCTIGSFVEFQDVQSDVSAWLSDTFFSIGRMSGY